MKLNPNDSKNTRQTNQETNTRLLHYSKNSVLK